jgi:hypothetical protein
MIQPIRTLIRDYSGPVDPDTGLPVVDRTERVADARERRLGELLRTALGEMTELLQSHGLDAATAQALAASQLYSILPSAARTAMTVQVGLLRTRLAAAVVGIKAAADVEGVERVSL